MTEPDPPGPGALLLALPLLHPAPPLALRVFILPSHFELQTMTSNPRKLQSHIKGEQVFEPLSEEGGKEWEGAPVD